MSAPPLHYHEFATEPALADDALCHWSFACALPPGAEHEHHVWPDGCVSLSVHLRDGERPLALVAGPGLEAPRVRLAGTAAWRGVRFWPDRGAAVLGVPAERLRGLGGPAAQVLGAREAESLAERVAAATDERATAEAFAGWLAPRVASAPARDPAVRAAVRATVAAHGARSVRSLAGDVGLSMRQLQRRFGRAVGLTPKEFARVRRVRSAIGAVLAREAAWPALAARFGWADQAHMVRDMAAVTGLTPALLEARLARIHHGAVTP